MENFEKNGFGGATLVTMATAGGSKSKQISRYMCPLCMTKIFCEPTMCIIRYHCSLLTMPINHMFSKMILGLKELKEAIEPYNEKLKELSSTVGEKVRIQNERIDKL